MGPNTQNLMELVLGCEDDTATVVAFGNHHPNSACALIFEDTTVRCISAQQANCQTDFQPLLETIGFNTCKNLGYTTSGMCATSYSCLH